MNNRDNVEVRRIGAKVYIYIKKIYTVFTKLYTNYLPCLHSIHQVHVDIHIQLFYIFRLT